MKYYIIAGEASGDLHASHLMKSIIKEDDAAEFRFFGGDNMTAAAEGRGVRVRHYRELAYMGFIPVLLHLPTILRNMRMCKKDITQWQPDVVILVDYAGFNLNIAKFLRTLQGDNAFPKTFYYIAPKLWAWKEYRIKNIKRDVDELFSILPFEKEFFEGKHNYPIHYVGNPTADEVRTFRKQYDETHEEFCKRHKLPCKPIIALLAGSRKQEIKDNLPSMIEATKGIDGYQFVIAGAPGIEPEFYATVIGTATVPCSSEQGPITLIHNDTYPLLEHSTAALVTSGTATLETCQFDVPQVVCYKVPMPKLLRWGFNHILKVKYISLVNLIADAEVVQELFADRFSISNIRRELKEILPGSPARERMLSDYGAVHDRLGNNCAPDNAARIIVSLLSSASPRR